MCVCVFFCCLLSSRWFSNANEQASRTLHVVLIWSQSHNIQHQHATIQFALHVCVSIYKSIDKWRALAAIDVCIYTHLIAMYTNHSLLKLLAIFCRCSRRVTICCVCHIFICHKRFPIVYSCASKIIVVVAAVFYGIRFHSIPFECEWCKYMHGINE